MVLDFNKFTFADTDILRGPILDEGTVIYDGWERVIEAAGANTGTCKIGYTGDDDAYEASIAFDADGTANAVTDIVIASTVAVIAPTSTYPKRYLLVTATASQTAITTGILELTFLAYKTAGPFRG
jgi:hypothetical protein